MNTREMEDYFNYNTGADGGIIKVFENTSHNR